MNTVCGSMTQLAKIQKYPSGVRETVCTETKDQTVQANATLQEPRYNTFKVTRAGCYRTALHNWRVE